MKYVGGIIKKELIKKYFLSIILLFHTILLCCSFTLYQNIVIENDNFRYEISANGKNLHFIDKTTGIDYLYTDTVSHCAYIVQNGKTYTIHSVSLKDNLLNFSFGESGVSAKVHIQSNNDYIAFKVIDVTGDVESLTFMNIPLKLEGQPYESFAACVLSMNLFTHVRQLPPLQTHLWAKCYKGFGLKGAEITLLGLPQQYLLSTIRDVITHAKEIPFSDAGGSWALMKKEGYGSYLMNFGTLTEETVDEWIETCHRLGFNQIDSHGGGDFFEFGTFDLNKKKWPEGWASFKRINEKLHKAGISHIFHTYSFFIDKNSKYVTPVPSKDLGYTHTFTIVEPIDESACEVTVKESTENISTITGFHTENSVTLKIGDELIVFSGVTKSPPYKFTGLKRGANGTKPSSHNSNETAFHLSERFGRFVPGPNTELFNEIAQRHAQIVNDCAFDGIYLDAIDGSAVLGGEENFWYYGTKFIFEIAKNLQHPVGMEMSSMCHLWWHYRSRWQAWDRPVRGYKRFIDIHLASIKAPGRFLPDEIKSNEWEHGIWPGHTPLIDKYAGIKQGQLLLPLHLGWWGNQTWSPPQVEPTFSDDIEYLACKMIGNDAGFSQLGGVDKKTMDEIPLFRQAADIIRQYEELRNKGYFGEEVKKLLRQPRKEYTLFKQDNGNWNFKPISYDKHKVTGLGHPTSRWNVSNHFKNQPVKLRIASLMSVKPYSDPANIILTASNSPGFSPGLIANGVIGQIKTIDEKTTTGDSSINFSALNSGESPQDGTYIQLKRKFEPIIDLSKNQGLGVWIKGDGNGQLLNISLNTPVYLSHGAHGDHYVKIDFTGWKYFELVELESFEFSNYIWPNDSHFYVYDTYRHTLDYKYIESIQFWYNNLPKGKEIKTLIGPVKAMPMLKGYIENPSVTIAGEKVVFPVRIESGMYLEFRSAEDCKLYGSKGELLKVVKPEGRIPELKNGKNEILFAGEDSEEYNTRVLVTVISEGNPLEVK